MTVPVLIVLGLNLAIAAVGFRTAAWLWGCRRRIARAADTLERCDRHARPVLCQTQSQLDDRASGLRVLRGRYRQLQGALQLLRGAIAVVGGLRQRRDRNAPPTPK